MPEKNSFDIFTEMHKADIENETNNVAISPYMVEANSGKVNGTVTMGVPASMVTDIINDKVMVILLVVNKKEYTRIKSA
jgi:hypothetical protein